MKGCKSFTYEVLDIYNIGGITMHINWKRYLTDFNWKGFLLSYYC
jgi:hypothetical protein